MAGYCKMMVHDVTIFQHLCVSSFLEKCETWLIMASFIHTVNWAKDYLKVMT